MAHHEGVEAAFKALAREFPRLVADPASRFAGMLRDEFDAYLRNELDEQDRQTVMMLVASCEAVFRRDFHVRATNPRNRRASLESKLRALHLAHLQAGTRAPLNSLLTIWESETQKAQLFTELRRLMKLRHWLAHGRYWTDKSGFSGDPRLALNLIENVFQANRAHSSDFPRLT